MKRFICICAAISLLAASVLAGCSSGTTPNDGTTEAVKDTTAVTEANTTEDSAIYTAGTYTATSFGRNGELTVETVFSDSAIVSITVKEHSETPVVSDLALEKIPQDIVQNQSLGVDIITGASMTSNAIKRAVSDCVEQAGGDASALSNVPVSYPDMPVENRETQILVIGGGTSGLLAAWSAAKEGVDVIVVEKQDILGGTFTFSGAGLITVDSEENDPAITDTLDNIVTMFKNFNESNNSVHEPDWDVFKAVMSQTGKTADIIYQAGMPGTFADWGNRGGGVSFTIGYALTEKMIDLCEEAGVEFILSTKATELVTDDTGAVVGAIVENRTGSYTISAEKTIVAAGGASWSTDLTDSQPAVKSVDLYEKTAVGSTGDGMRMLAAIGAQMAEDIYVKSSQVQFALLFGYDWSNTPSTNTTFMIDENGERFYHEDADQKVMNSMMIEHESGSYWTILDGSNSQAVADSFFEAVQTLAKDDNERVCVYAETLEELAKKIGVDAENLKATFDDYQAACDSKSDTFGKAEENLVAYDTESGFYAVYRRPGSWGTIGGAIVDAQMHVLDTEGNIIPGVFAVGETATSQLFGDYYVGGFSLGLYTTAGRIAAETAVSELK